jgi:hypothetical protein
MANPAGRIIKRCDVKVEGNVCLDVTQMKKGPSQANSQVVPQAARLIESKPEFAVIEVTCSCGTKMLVRCQYAGVQAGVQTSAGGTDPPVQ